MSAAPGVGLRLLGIGLLALGWAGRRAGHERPDTAEGRGAGRQRAWITTIARTLGQAQARRAGRR